MRTATVLSSLALFLVLSVGLGACNKSPATEIPEVSANTPSSVSGTTAQNGFDSMPAVGTKAFCPVMKQEFTVNENSPSTVYEGKTYVFCCPGCKEKFEADPQSYL